ncbi:MAG: glycosyltransferase [candidate division Zixibacteria bacterium]|nr:glycosyltransferase [candidate division Zixibacteria bacterium]
MKKRQDNSLQKHLYGVSVVVPMYNEEQNVSSTLSRIAAAFRAIGGDWEIIAVDDGSTDRTALSVLSFAEKEPRVRLVSYFPNRGRGWALRQGFAASTKEIIITADADLSYSEEYLLAMAQILQAHPEVDIVVASPYTKGGGVENVPFWRLFISKLGNKILGFAMKRGLATVTGMVRGYRRKVLEALELESEGKEIHLEILARALGMGYRVLEMPAVLKARKLGKSKFKFTATAASHILFSFHEKPVLLFGAVGLFLVFLSFGGAGYIWYLWQKGNLNPTRPLVTLTVLAFLAGLATLFFGFLGTQLVHLKREIYRIQKTAKETIMKLEELSGGKERLDFQVRVEKRKREKV